MVALNKHEEQIDEIQEIRVLISELADDCDTLLHSELTELQRISSFTESVSKRLKQHYSKIFPKKCNSCGRVYLSRDDFWSETKGLRTTDTVFDEVGLQEYRNCHCGSTLIVWTQDRRDNSEFGQARRELFDECVEKLSSISHVDRSEAVDQLRRVFSKVVG